MWAIAIKRSGLVHAYSEKLVRPASLTLLPLSAPEFHVVSRHPSGYLRAGRTRPPGLPQPCPVLSLTALQSDPPAPPMRTEVVTAVCGIGSSEVRRYMNSIGSITLDAAGRGQMKLKDRPEKLVVGLTFMPLFKKM
jgi:hypothetical protein